MREHHVINVGVSRDKLTQIFIVTSKKIGFLPSDLAKQKTKRFQEIWFSLKNVLRLHIDNDSVSICFRALSLWALFQWKVQSTSRFLSGLNQKILLWTDKVTTNIGMLNRKLEGRMRLDTFFNIIVPLSLNKCLLITFESDDQAYWKTITKHFFNPSHDCMN